MNKFLEIYLFSAKIVYATTFITVLSTFLMAYLINSSFAIIKLNDFNEMLPETMALLFFVPAFLFQSFIELEKLKEKVNSWLNKA